MRVKFTGLAASTMLTCMTIPPLSILTPSSRGAALAHFEAADIDEISMEKGETFRVYRRYQFWAYIIKDRTGERGWMPSWLIGAVPERQDTQLALAVQALALLS